MGDDIFVKRVDFEENNNNETAVSTASPLLANGDSNNHDLEKYESKKKDEAPKKKPTTCCGKFNALIDKIGIKSALGHIGLLLGLGLYCFAGGWVN